MICVWCEKAQPVHQGVSLEDLFFCSRTCMGEYKIENDAESLDVDGSDAMEPTGTGGNADADVDKLLERWKRFIATYLPRGSDEVLLKQEVQQWRRSFPAHECAHLYPGYAAWSFAQAIVEENKATSDTLISIYQNTGVIYHERFRRAVQFLRMYDNEGVFFKDLRFHPRIIEAGLGPQMAEILNRKLGKGVSFRPGASGSELEVIAAEPPRLGRFAKPAQNYVKSLTRILEKTNEIILKYRKPAYGQVMQEVAAALRIRLFEARWLVGRQKFQELLQLRDGSMLPDGYGGEGYEADDWEQSLAEVNSSQLQWIACLAVGGMFIGLGSGLSLGYAVLMVLGLLLIGAIVGKQIALARVGWTGEDYAKFIQLDRRRKDLKAAQALRQEKMVDHEEVAEVDPDDELSDIELAKKAFEDLRSAFKAQEDLEGAQSAVQRRAAAKRIISEAGTGDISAMVRENLLETGAEEIDQANSA
ncbi:MAG: hypothetical protein CMH54_01680 [Myxococcales bacterium]|nr:hypothetical protein [Myxococcales bacterium]